MSSMQHPDQVPYLYLVYINDIMVVMYIFYVKYTICLYVYFIDDYFGLLL